ncbi:hypothetical protein [Glaciimonas soli]|uniref:Uncharacterized protein n=1 Tax=Glaciimonas soli TaxID=2590999 RepID=A0A843YWM2_9BURK|nr:hypothetical protein [Glaciimonas soli]MQR01622.1 hypothetical protein [Glaciimonas soli]
MSKQHSIATIDKRPYFEKALAFGVKNAIISHEKCQTIIADGAKGTLQVADFFGTKHLQSDLENARLRITHLVSLYLEDRFEDNLKLAAESLRDNTFLSHSRGGNEMLKALHALPNCTVFGDSESQSVKEFQNEHTLKKPFSLKAYRKERQVRLDAELTMHAALWFAEQMQVAQQSALDFTSAETVIRTALLLRASGVEEYANNPPTRLAFAHALDHIRTQFLASGKFKISKKLLDDVPSEYSAITQKVRREIEKNDASLILNASMTLAELINTIELRYFIADSGMEEIGSFDALIAKEWHKITQGKEDPYSRLTVFLCLAASIKPKTTLSETEARTIIRQVREFGFDNDAVASFIKDEAPFELKENLLALWEEEFLPEAEQYLLDEDDLKYMLALKFLKENCNIKSKDAANK